ncbi:uncharacterized protein LOC131213220 [Anopheles bellator]|uniref:uncharacterized protein LOC131213220 n=1 Tax=Anopheles bellator TaxID=139047 RepID=UPI002647B85D|nr:uncharacterized protein LOC131213220 [Anopheles bellator]
MMRQLCSLCRLVLQASRKHAKPLILITSFVVFVWLILDTVHRPEFVRQNNPPTGDTDRWDETNVHHFLTLLDIDPNATASKADCWPPTSGGMLVSAFAGSSLVENLWHYFSLIAVIANLRTMAPSGYTVQGLLTRSARDQLRQMFVSIPYVVIDERTFDCYDLSAACVLNDINLLDVPERGNQLYILNNNVKRLYEIVKVQWKEQWVHFNVGAHPRQWASQLLANIGRQAVLSDPSDHSTGQAPNTQFVCLNVGDDDGLPFEYYFRAVAFQRKMHGTDGTLVFVALCETLTGTVCKLLNAPAEHIYTVQRHDDPATNFVLLQLCNHTIVSAELDIFPALLRDEGTTVIYERYTDDLLMELTNLKENWYPML